MHAKLNASWVVLALLAPPCQERNPAFDEPSAGTGDTSATATTMPTADDGVMTTAMPDGSGSGSGASGSASGDATDDGTPTTGTPGSDGTTDVATGSSGSGPATGSTGDGCPDTMCGGQCVDLQTDPDHCGECFNDCHPVQEICEMGICVNN